MYPPLSIAQLLAQAYFAVTSARAVETVLAASHTHAMSRYAPPVLPSTAALVAPMCSLGYGLSMSGDPLMMVAAAVQVTASVAALILPRVMKPVSVTANARSSRPSTVRIAASTASRKAASSCACACACMAWAWSGTRAHGLATRASCAAPWPSTPASWRSPRAASRLNFREGVDGVKLADRGFAGLKVILLPVEYTLTGDRAIDMPMKEFIAAMPVSKRNGSKPQKFSNRSSNDNGV